MKTTLKLLFTVLILSSINFAQTNQKNNISHEKIEELKNIKLIEYLKIDEEASIKLIARKNQHNKNILKLISEKDSLLEAARNLMSNKTANIAKINDQILNIDLLIVKERLNYFNSLSDILNNEKILKYLLFEKVFKMEIRKMMKKRAGKE